MLSHNNIIMHWRFIDNNNNKYDYITVLNLGSVTEIIIIMKLITIVVVNHYNTK